jgi:SAM-dependent methyltransferase
VLQEPTFEFDGYQIPIRLIELTGGGPQTFGLIAKGHMAQLAQYAPIGPTHNIVEIGCGIGRDALPLTGVLTTGRYLGIDIARDSIEWCSGNITPKHPNFEFIHYDVQDQLHNPNGTTHTADIVLPIDDGSIDRVIAQSVLTHMTEADITHYLRQFKRIMRPGAIAFLTCFIVYPEILSAAQHHTERTPFHLTFEHNLSDGCFINDPNHPMGAVAYTPEALTRMMDRGGFYDFRFARGNWSGALPIPSAAQDALVLYAN